VPADVHAELFEAVAAKNSHAKVKIDLPNQTLTTPSGRQVPFPVDSFAKHCLLEGVDEIGYTLQREAEIAAYEARRVGSVNTLA
jgi:3-isopropylmalate/(R)-2-methylmalate dehydratase small subunit